jgi:riboflavin kinase/FMN adenylyltransferase
MPAHEPLDNGASLPDDKNMSPVATIDGPRTLGSISIGNFDGVHLGHQALLARTRAQTRQLGGPAVAVTFDPHPLQLLRPEQFQPVLTALPDRVRLLNEHVDQVVVLPVTREFLALTAEEFFVQVVQGQLQAGGFVEGFNFRFGRDRQGTVALLAELCRAAGIAFEVVPPLEQQGAPVSSSRVRSALLQGEVRQAAGLLGRSYFLRGRVGTGQRRGRTLGFPTANLEEVPSLIPGDGVYAARVDWLDGHWPAAANIGPNPTFGEQARKLEVHLIGFQGDLYGQELTVTFLERIRATRPFAGVNELVAQLQRDVARARQLNEESGR